MIERILERLEEEINMSPSYDCEDCAYIAGLRTAIEIVEKASEYQGKYWHNISEIEARQTAKGVKEYGQTLEQNQEPNVEERISYIEEELVDALKYLEWLKEGMSNERRFNG